MIRTLAILLCLPSIVFAQDAARATADEFLKALFSGSPSLNAFADDSTLMAANRLGIRYDGVPAKYLISYDIDEEIRMRVKDRRTHYTSTLAPCGWGYKRLTVETDQPKIKREFYFRNGRVTSPFFFYTAGWRAIETKYFRFVVSDSSLTNRYAMESLDRFVDTIGSILAFTDKELKLLRDKKILYYLCSNEDEIERLTGYRTRGMYNLAYDAVISTYNWHAHELAHLLINYKVRSARLYCHPFLLEGFAVAVGGRGGIGADAAASLGSFLDRSRFLSYTELLTRQGFASVDPSMSYPAAGLYNAFLLESLGSAKYLDLYRRHCGNSNDSSVTSISESEPPPATEWNAFLERRQHHTAIGFRSPTTRDTLVYHNDSVSVYRGEKDYFFAMRSACLIGEGSADSGYRSKKFSELLPAIPYRGCKYLVVADSQSVSVYHLLTNTLIAGYVASLSLPPAPVPFEAGMFRFSIPADVFDEPLESLLSDRARAWSGSAESDAMQLPDSYDWWLGGGFSAGIDRYHGALSFGEIFLSLGGYNTGHTWGEYTLSYRRIVPPEKYDPEFSIRDGITMVQAGLEGRSFYDPADSAFSGYYCFGGGLAYGTGHYSLDVKNGDRAGRLYRIVGVDLRGGFGIALGRVNVVGTTLELTPGCIVWMSPEHSRPVPVPQVYYYLTLRLGMNYSIASWK